MRRWSSRKTFETTLPAIGMVEARGLLAAYEAADAMFKAAHVRLVSKEQMGGIVTIIVRGEIGPVRAAVDAGAEAAAHAGELIGATVLSHPHEGMAELMPGLVERESDPDYE